MGGVAGGIGIKVGIMVPACCECDPGGSIADPLFPEAPVFGKVPPKYGMRYAPEVWAERCDPQNHARQREENE
jgi:hypothetical protein